MRKVKNMDPTNTNAIVVKDIKMPFLSMVIFMVMGGMGRQWF
jgi:hypothetical protein